MAIGEAVKIQQIFHVSILFVQIYLYWYFHFDIVWTMKNWGKIAWFILCFQNYPYDRQTFALYAAHVFSKLDASK